MRPGLQLELTWRRSFGGVLHHFAALFAFLRVFWKYFFQAISKWESSG
jgi:hypothetical protein